MLIVDQIDWKLLFVETQTFLKHSVYKIKDQGYNPFQERRGTLTRRARLVTVDYRYTRGSWTAPLPKRNEFFKTTGDIHKSIGERIRERKFFGMNERANTRGHEWLMERDSFINFQTSGINEWNCIGRGRRVWSEGRVDSFFKRWRRIVFEHSTIRFDFTFSVTL